MQWGPRKRFGPLSLLAAGETVILPLLVVPEAVRLRCVGCRVTGRCGDYCFTTGLRRSCRDICTTCSPTDCTLCIQDPMGVPAPSRAPFTHPLAAIAEGEVEGVPPEQVCEPIIPLACRSPRGRHQPNTYQACERRDALPSCLQAIMAG